MTIIFKMRTYASALIFPSHSTVTTSFNLSCFSSVGKECSMQNYIVLMEGAQITRNGHLYLSWKGGIASVSECNRPNVVRSREIYLNNFALREN